MLAAPFVYGGAANTAPVPLAVSVVGGGPMLIVGLGLLLGELLELGTGLVLVDVGPDGA